MTQPYPADQPSHPPEPGYPAQPGHPSQSDYSTQPGYPPQLGHPAPKPSLNGFAVASLVAGIFGGVLLSVIFGIVALVQMRRRPYRGRGMAIAGLVLSGLWVLGLATLVVVAIASDADRDSSGQVTGGGSVSTRQLRPGDCVNDVKESDNVLSLPAVPCAQSHQGEVFAAFTIPGASWPGDGQVSTAPSRAAGIGCRGTHPASTASRSTCFPCSRRGIRGARATTVSPA